MDTLLVMRRSIKKPATLEPKHKPQKMKLCPPIVEHPSPHEFHPKISFVQLYNDLCTRNLERKRERRARSANSHYVETKDAATSFGEYGRIMSESVDSVLKAYLEAHCNRIKSERTVSKTCSKRQVKTKVLLELDYDDPKL